MEAMTTAQPHSRSRRVRARLDKARRELPLLWGAERRNDLKLLARGSGDPGSPRRVLIAAPGGGNIGDQALLEAVLETTDAPFSVVVRNATDVQIPATFAERVELVVLPDLLYGEGDARIRDLDRLSALLTDAGGLWVIGADIMDGRYALRASVRRATLAQAAAERGLDARILGFSWSGAPRVAARRAVVAATRAGAVPYLRDPLSARRAITDGFAGPVEVADIVFAATARQAPPLVKPTRPYAIVNASGLVARKVDQTRELVQVVRRLGDEGLEVVILPHVSVPSSDDFVPCRALQAASAGTRVRLVETILEPAQVRALARDAECVVTGRMHLAVMAMSQGVPAITLATQGKVEGLMELLGTPELCVEPRAGCGTEILAALDVVLPDDSATRAALARNVPDVIELARVSTRMPQVTETA